MKKVAEICCDSLEGALIAEKAGADRIELNSSMYLYGLTPSIGTIDLVTQHCHIPIVAMARPRPGGFRYNENEFQTMYADIEAMLDYNIEGIAFGCLDEHREIDKDQCEKIVDLIHKYDKDAIFHRAFDAVEDPFQSIETLIDLGVKRVLTGGLTEKAVNGINLLAALQEKYGDKIEILAGGGVTSGNVADLIRQTGISQYHSSCKSWRKDPTTVNRHMSFAFAQPPHEEYYNVVDYERAVQFVASVKK